MKEASTRGGALAKLAAVEILNHAAHEVPRGLEGARAHLATAMALLSKRRDPDCRTSIKESISAVESVAKRISGQTASGLTPALRALGEKTEFHGALRSGFEKLYGFTSDERGIRHAILDQENVGFDEAKFMLVE